MTFSEDKNIPFEDWPIEEQNEFMKEYYPWKEHGGSFGADSDAEKKIIEEWIAKDPFEGWSEEDRMAFMDMHHPEHRTPF
jgi:hypothetical protein